MEPGVHKVLAGCSIRIGPQIGQRHNLIALPHPSRQSLSRSQALRGRGAGPLPRIEALHELEPLATVRIGVDSDQPVFEVPVVENLVARVLAAGL